MHSADCPSCGSRVEFDFLPVAGMVWCAKCQKMFSPPVAAGPEPRKPEQTDAGNGKAE
jgi:hypothetical protein